MYALFRNGKQISKAHKHRICVLIEAFERKVLYTGRGRIFWDSQYKIREVV